MLDMSKAEYGHGLQPSITKSVVQSVDADLEDARKVLQTQITNLRHASLTVRQRGVLLPPVHRLPEELLCSVFLYLTLDDCPSSRDDLGWINTTHVCQYWRLVALSNATLWWDLNFNLGRQWVHTILARSQGLPLEIALVVLSGEEYEYADHLVRKCMERVTTLFMDVPQALPGRLDGVFVGSAPFLESFEFFNDTENLFPSPIDPEPTLFSLPAAFLDHENCPRLESLSLSGCVVPSCASRDLTALSLRNLFADDLLPLFQLLPQLHHMSLLTLHFHKSVNLHGDEEKWVDIRDSLKSTAMPHLAKFDLEGKNPECEMIMHYLAAPHLSAFFLQCTIITGSLDEFSYTRDELRGFIGRSGITAKHRADISASIMASEGHQPGDDYTCHIGVSSWSMSAHADTASEVSNGVSVEFSWPDDTVPSLLTLAADVCHAVRLGDVHALDLDFQENIFDAEVLNEIESLLLELTSLRTLTVDGIAGDDEDAILFFLSENGYMRPYENNTEGHHFEVVRSALLTGDGKLGPSTTPALTSHPDDGTYDLSLSAPPDDSSDGV